MATRPCLLTRPRRSRVLFCVIAVVATTLLSNGFAFHGTVCTTSPSPPVSCDEGRGAFPPASGRAEVEKTRKLQERGWVGGAMIVAIGIAGLGNAVSKRDRSAVSAVPERKEARSWVQESIPVLLIMILVAQKCSADALTWYTRAKQHVPYSGSNVALLSEVFKFPVLMLAVSIFNSPKQVLPTIRAAFTESPFTMWWLGLLYAVQNLLYFVCLQYTSAAAYQVLSQTKMIFTAAFMGQMLGKKFSQTQILALIMLVIGTSFTQLAEIQGPMVAGSRPWLGAGLAVLSALLSALPNVFYERVLKEQKNQWVSNLQITIWIATWVLIIKGCGMFFGGTRGFEVSGMLSGFNIMVWVIVMLKTLNCIIIPACLKYADNILYGYAKPISIVLTVIVTSCLNFTLPAPTMLIGTLLVLTSIVIYGRG
ncbi:UDP-N-acetylglucosamine transporter (Golgi UDP-GlcNAc transporter) (Solute carrier family 35 member A3) [Durusdinium trenchii]|uniref:UDP-N-acetylglucosamine transporter (Golgi UDP-GlcNAc transporter) (Solute carrier family 35 member A3) n=1 Tax=Durusdinium trenchii TaxID=1381693 RepID=A0ABP0M603_9DINO